MPGIAEDRNQKKKKSTLAEEPEIDVYNETEKIMHV